MKCSVQSNTTLSGKLRGLLQFIRGRKGEECCCASQLLKQERWLQTEDKSTDENQKILANTQENFLHADLEIKTH